MKRFNRLMMAWIKRHPMVAGEVRPINVAHDDWCRMLRGKGDCNCNPVFSYGEVPFNKGDFYTATIIPGCPPARNN